MVQGETYKDQKLFFNKNQKETEIGARIAKAWIKFLSLREVLKAPFTCAQESQVFNLCCTCHCPHSHFHRQIRIFELQRLYSRS